MNKTVVWVLVIAVLLGGGAGWYYMKNNARNTEDISVLDADGDTDGDENVDMSQNATTTASSTPTASEGVLVGNTREFTVEGKNFSFTPSTIKVKKGERVKITFKNVSGFHDFRIDAFGTNKATGVGTARFQGPKEESFEFTADTTGSFEYYCSVGTHRAMGMKGILVVE